MLLSPDCVVLELQRLKIFYEWIEYVVVTSRWAAAPNEVSFVPLSLDLPDARFSILFLIEWLKIVFYKLTTSNSVGLSKQLSKLGKF